MNIIAIFCRLTKIVKKFIEYYKNHIPSEMMKKYDIPSLYLFHQILNYFKVTPHTAKENTNIQFKNMSVDDKIKRGNKISSNSTLKGRKRTEEERKHIKEGILKAFKEHPVERKPNNGQFKKGQSPWNKGLKGAQKWIDGQSEKRMQTMKNNGSIGKFKTSIEKIVENDLIIKYGKDNVLYQYKDKERYPFYCDFYIKSEDLFIELNAHWTHGGKPYNPDDKECQEQLQTWQEKAKTSQFYANAITTWTIRDVNKLKCAKDNKLNYKVIYVYNNEFK